MLSSSPNRIEAVHTHQEHTTTEWEKAKGSESVTGGAAGPVTCHTHEPLSHGTNVTIEV